MKAPTKAKAKREARVSGLGRKAQQDANRERQQQARAEARQREAFAAADGAASFPSVLSDLASPDVQAGLHMKPPPGAKLRGG